MHYSLTDLEQANPRHRDRGSPPSSSMDSAGDYISSLSQKPTACSKILQDPAQPENAPSRWQRAKKQRQNCGSALCPSQRQDYRRKGPRSQGTGPRRIPSPSNLVRQPQTSNCFAKCLVKLATGLIKATWPLGITIRRSNIVQIKS
jgi:hypothetical protein